MTPRPWTRYAGAIGTTALIFGMLTAVPASARTTEPTAGSGDSSVSQDLATVRNYTSRYQDINVALADGFQPPDPYVCVAGPEGTMGYHYLRWDRLDNELDIRKPELLLYVPGDGKGGLRLVGVEYMKPDADQNLSTANDRPTLFGQPFNGPMGPHEPGMPIHYDLHVWIWSDNPNGTFAQWNPSVSC
jgi:hypothetical protein